MECKKTVEIVLTFAGDSVIILLNCNYQTVEMVIWKITVSDEGQYQNRAKIEKEMTYG
jgi:hypothetical protein